MVKYDGSFKKIKIICKEHGEFDQLAWVHLQGSGCSLCTHVISQAEIKWLTQIESELGYELEKQFCIKSPFGGIYEMDGFDSKTNTCYEFHGDFWHGNPKLYDSERIHPVKKKTFRQLYQETIDREKYIKSLGYNLVVMWESDFNALNKIL